MSTEANAALAWPVEVTEFAYLGDWLVDHESTPAIVREVWIRDQDQTPNPLTLCGTDVPGGVEFSLDSTLKIVQELYRIGRFYEDPRNGDPLYNPRDEQAGVYYPPVPLPCIGDPRMDPTVLEEGCMLPWFQPWQMWDSLDYSAEVEVKPTPAVPAWMDPNEPEDYDSMVRYHLGEIPGLDGVTYEDGTRVEESAQ